MAAYLTVLSAAVLFSSYFAYGKEIDGLSEYTYRGGCEGSDVFSFFRFHKEFECLPIEEEFSFKLEETSRASLGVQLTKVPQRMNLINLRFGNVMHCFF